MGVWELRPIAECIGLTGKKPVEVCWADVSKGDDDSSDFRCCIVANDFNVDKRPELFAATPPSSICDTLHRGAHRLSLDPTRRSSWCKTRRSCISTRLRPEMSTLTSRQNGHSRESVRSFTKTFMEHVARPLIGRRPTERFCSVWGLSRDNYHLAASSTRHGA